MCAPSLRKTLVHIFKHKSADRDALNFLKEAIEKNGGFAYTMEKMLFFREEALKLLYGFPVSATRSALEKLVRYTTDRVN
jgi:octaprenyl-diphosphate synthase